MKSGMFEYLTLYATSLMVNNKKYVRGIVIFQTDKTKEYNHEKIYIVTTCYY